MGPYWENHRAVDEQDKEVDVIASAKRKASVDVDIKDEDKEQHEIGNKRQKMGSYRTRTVGPTVIDLT